MSESSWAGIVDRGGILTLGLVVVGIGNALTSRGAHLGESPIVMCGMLLLGSGGGLLNGETQKAIMSVVTGERAGMASGIRTTLRFSGILGLCRAQRDPRHGRA